MDVKCIHLVTGNQNKLNEIINILGSDFSCKIKPVKIDLPEYQGDEYFIVKEKCKFAFEKIKKSVIVEDTSLRINCLNGLPGPYIKDFLIKIGSSNIVKLIQAWQDKTAEIVCLIGYIDENNLDCKIFEGILKGKLVEPKGNYGFGFDNIFIPDSYNQTLAELGDKVKNEISHRSLVLKELKNFLIKQN